MAYGFYSNEDSHGMGDNANVSPSIKIGSGLGIPSPPAVAFNWQEGPNGSLGMSDADTGGEPPVRVHQTLAVAEQSVVRRLTPVECCRLQGFPDDWNIEGITKEGKRIPMADAPRYRQLGNAVTVNVANWIANNLATVYAESKERTDGEP
jgi:DNA (cytosine-5)-methyltransferase 1